MFHSSLALDEDHYVTLDPFALPSTKWLPVPTEWEAREDRRYLENRLKEHLFPVLGIETRIPGCPSRIPVIVLRSIRSRLLNSVAGGSEPRDVIRED